MLYDPTGSPEFLMHAFCDYYCLLTFYTVENLCLKWTGKNAVEFNEANEIFTVDVHVVVKTLNLEISRYRLRRLRQIILLKHVPHVQHDYFSSFTQSDDLFIALSLPMPSCLLKVPNQL